MDELEDTESAPFVHMSSDVQTALSLFSIVKESANSNASIRTSRVIWEVQNMIFCEI